MSSSIDVCASAEVDFMMAYGLLKLQPRTGWTRFPPLSFWPSSTPPPPPPPPTANVPTFSSSSSSSSSSPAFTPPLLHHPRVESVLDHSGRLALMCMLSRSPPPFDKGRASMIALVHDMPEATVSDITPDSGVSREEKIRREMEAVGDMLRGMQGSDVGEATRENAGAMRCLWEEYEAQETAEARFVKDCDRVEMMLQALEYETRNGVALDTFFETTKGKARFEQTIQWDKEIRRRREVNNKGKDSENAGEK